MANAVTPIIQIIIPKEEVSLRKDPKSGELFSNINAKLGTIIVNGTIQQNHEIIIKHYLF